MVFFLKDQSTCHVKFCKKTWTKIENRKFRETKFRKKFLKGLKIKFDIFRRTKNIFSVIIYYKIHI
jgi:hypothetical protein